MTKKCNANHKKLRYVLLLDLSNKAYQWNKNFEALGWHGIYSINTHEAIQLVKKHNITVAIAMISSAYQQCVFKAVHHISSETNGIAWIAVSSDNQFPDYPLTSQYSSYFFDYHHLPIDWSKMGYALGHAFGMAALTAEKPKSGNKDIQCPTLLLGKSAAIQQLKSTLAKVAAVDDSVFIGGETGTGKGLCARLIHAQSDRRNGPFITINCGGLPPTLIHSELFGHEKGAFTGAGKTYIGHIERADKGTLFLDEIGDLTLECQIHLLQFLDDHTIERLGGSHRRQVDCRIIFASHVDLEDAVMEGRFREDLYHRLNILPIHAPPLREHREDIELLANEFLRTSRPTGTGLSFTASAIEAMLRYEWPGNVRELMNRIQRAVVMADNSTITEIDLGITLLDPPSPKPNLAHRRTELDTDVLLDAIKRNNHNISAAARELDISRTTFYRMIKKCKISL